MHSWRWLLSNSWTMSFGPTRLSQPAGTGRCGVGWATRAGATPATDSLESSQCPARLRTLAQFTMVTQHGTALACSECGRGGRYKSSVTLEFYDGFLCFLGERPDGNM